MLFIQSTKEEAVATYPSRNVSFNVTFLNFIVRWTNTSRHQDTNIEPLPKTTFQDNSRCWSDVFSCVMIV